MKAADGGRTRAGTVEKRGKGSMTESMVWTEEMDSPIGTLTLCATAQGLCAIEFGTWPDEGPASPARASAREREPADPEAESEARRHLREAKRQLDEYFAGKRTEFSVELHLTGTPFQQKVWRALQDIPYGETRSYKNIGEAIGAPRSARAVGGANNRNPVPIIVPCHRVIAADGGIAGYGGGLPIKRFLLDLEKRICFG